MGRYLKWKIFWRSIDKKLNKIYLKIILIFKNIKLEIDEKTEVCVTYRRQIFNLKCIIKSKIEKSETEAEKSNTEESDEEIVIRSSARLKRDDYSTRDFQENADLNPVKKANVPSSIKITRINNAVSKPASTSVEINECTQKHIQSAQTSNSVLNEDPLANNPRTSRSASVNYSAKTINAAPNTLSTQAIQSFQSSSSTSKQNSETNIQNCEPIEYSVQLLMEKAHNGEFPKKTFIIEGKQKLFSSALNFFRSQNVFEELPRNTVKFQCKICSVIINVHLNKSSNVYKHLTNHAETVEWHKLY